MNDHFQDNIYECFAVQACVSEWVRECVSREVDCILYGMFNVGKKKLNSPLLPTAVCFYTLSSTVTAICRAAQHSLMPSVFHHHFSVTPTESESIVYWTQAYVFAILKEEIQSCDRLRNTLLWVRGRRRAALVHSLP